MNDTHEIRVLIVDDQEVYSAALAGLLEVVGGYTVVGFAATGEEGVAMAAATGPDLVFMDLRLPGIDGLEATRSILATRPAPAVVMMSTDLEAVRADGVRRSGALDGLAKADLDLAWLDSLRERLPVG